jgi:hypothetical protein
LKLKRKKRRPFGISISTPLSTRFLNFEDHFSEKSKPITQVFRKIGTKIEKMKAVEGRLAPILKTMFFGKLKAVEGRLTPILETMFFLSEYNRKGDVLPLN